MRDFVLCYWCLYSIDDCALRPNILYGAMQVGLERPSCAAVAIIDIGEGATGLCSSISQDWNAIIQQATAAARGFVELVGCLACA